MIFPGLQRTTAGRLNQPAMVQRVDSSRRYAASAANVSPAGNRVTTSGRFLVEPVWPEGGYGTRRLADNNWTIQQYTGYPISTVGQGQWVRGQLVRFAVPTLQPDSKFLFAYDPTDVSTWKYAGSPG